MTVLIENVWRLRRIRRSRDWNLCQGGKCEGQAVDRGGLWVAIEPLIPTRPLRNRGRRLPVGGREALTSILFVLRTRFP